MVYVVDSHRGSLMGRVMAVVLRVYGAHCIT
jgi:hypothetical protein